MTAAYVSEPLALRPFGAHEPFRSEVGAEADRLDYEGAKAVLARVLTLPRPGDYDAFLLSLAQTYLNAVLDKVWHLGFVGTKPAGKSTGLRC